MLGEALFPTTLQVFQSTQRCYWLSTGAHVYWERGSVAHGGLLGGL